MSSSRRRLALVAGALVLLSIIGAGLAQAAAAPSSSPTSARLAADEPPGRGERFPRLRQRLGEFGFGRFGT